MRLWHRLEDQWYALLDRLDEARIPVYSLIDPIDKVVPSLAIFLLAILMIGGWFAYPLVSNPTPEYGELLLTLTDEDGKPFSEAVVQLTWGDTKHNQSTNEDGVARFKNIPLGSAGTFRVEHPGYVEASIPFVLHDPLQSYSMVLQKILPSAQPAYFHLVGKNNLLLEGKPITITWTCGGDNPSTKEEIIADGVWFIPDTSSCATLTATLKGEGYQPMTDQVIDPLDPIIALKPIHYATGTVRVQVEDAIASSPAHGVLIQLFTHDGVLAGHQYSSTQGSAAFSEIPFGKYYITLTHPEGKYAASVGTPFDVLSTSAQNKLYYLLPSHAGKLSIHVTDSSTNDPLPGAAVKIQRVHDGIVAAELLTNGGGDIPPYSPEAKGEYRIAVVKKGYLSTTLSVQIGDEDQTIPMGLTPMSGNEGIIRVRVRDSSYQPLPGVQLLLLDTETSALHLGTNPVLTDGGGVGTFTGILPGSYYVRGKYYPYLDVLSPIVLLEGNEEEEMELTFQPTLIPGVFQAPTPEANLSSMECEEGCENPLFATLSPSTTLAPYEAGSFTLHVENMAAQPVENVHVSLSYSSGEGNPPIAYGYYSTDAEGSVAFSLPSSVPGTQYILSLSHPEHDPLTLIIPVTSKVVSFNSDPVAFTLPLINAYTTAQPVIATNHAVNTVSLVHAHVIGVHSTYLDPYAMALQTMKANPQSIPAGGQLPLSLHAITLPNMAAQVGDLAEGQFLLTFESTQKQKWVESLPFTTILENMGECDGSGITVNGMSGNNILLLDAFQKSAAKEGVLQNTCTKKGIPVDFPRLSAKVKWEGKPIGIIQLQVTDSTTGKKFQVNIGNEHYTPVLEPFAHGAGHPITLAFTPGEGYVGQKGNFTLYLLAEDVSGNTLAEKGFPYTLHASGLETCVKIIPTPGAGVYIPADTTNGFFTLDTTACPTPVDIQFCSEPGNHGCSGGAPQGKISLSAWTIPNLSGVKKVTVNREKYTLPGSYDVTVRARSTGPYQTIARIAVRVDAPKEYALEMGKTSFSLVGKGATDSTLIVNRLLKENVSVTSALCNWITVTETEEAPWGPVFIASSAANILADQLIFSAAFDFSIIGAILPEATAGVITAIETVIQTAVTNFLTSIGVVSSVSTAGGEAAVALLNPCVPCIIIGILVTIILQFLLADDEEVDLCQIMVTVDEMTDYVINLQGVETEAGSIPPDALAINLYGPHAKQFGAKWSFTKKGDYLQSGENDQEAVGAVFTNTSGYSEPTPTFGVAELVVKEHVHGDPEHEGKAEVECSEDTFLAYYIGPSDEQGACEGAEDIVRKEKFHVRYKTAEYPQTLPVYLDDRKACQTGSINGFTGSDSLPNVAFNWKWNEEVGLPLYVCDAANPHGIYCDATQFTIDVMKRTRALEEFLAANNHQFQCPDDPTKTPDNITFTIEDPVEIQDVKIHSYSYDFEGLTTIRLGADIENLKGGYQDIQFTGSMTPTTNLGDFNATLHPPTCTVKASLIPGETFKLSCLIAGLPPAYHLMRWSIVDVNTGKNLGQYATGLSVKKYTGENPSCDHLSKTTAIQGGKPIINQWIDAADQQFGDFVNEDNLVFTPTIPSIEALNQILHYEAHLIQDGYSPDFEEDFKEYYTKNAFADSPPWFKGGGGQPGYQQFLGEGKTFSVRTQYGESSTLTASGRYHVDIDVEIEGDDWQFFDEEGKPKLTIHVKLLHRADPAPDSPFYRLPFDGEIGRVGEQFDRKGYGLNFVNENGFILLNESPVITYTNTGNSTYSQLLIQKKEDFKTLNTDPSTRGQLLHVTAPNGIGANILQFTPSLATPLMMRIKNTGTTPFSAFYQVGEGGNPVDSGPNLTYWSGIEACADFTGNPSDQAFHQAPDREGKKTDKRTDWEIVYGLDWKEATEKGELYLRTILYTPTNLSYTINSASSSTSFLTSNYGSYSNLQILDGTKNLLYNNKSTEINSLQDVFDLVADGSVCIEDNGVEARFFWNTSALYQEVGQTSIADEFEKLVPGDTCIAP